MSSSKSDKILNVFSFDSAVINLNKPMTIIYNVAELAKVSVKTVSSVMN